MRPIESIDNPSSHYTIRKEMIAHIILFFAWMLVNQFLK